MKLSRSATATASGTAPTTATAASSWFTRTHAEEALRRDCDAPPPPTDGQEYAKASREGNDGPVAAEARLRREDQKLKRHVRSQMSSYLETMLASTALGGAGNVVSSSSTTAASPSSLTSRPTTQQTDRPVRGSSRGAAGPSPRGVGLGGRKTSSMAPRASALEALQLLGFLKEPSTTSPNASAAVAGEGARRGGAGGIFPSSSTIIISTDDHAARRGAIPAAAVSSALPSLSNGGPSMTTSAKPCRPGASLTSSHMEERVVRLGNDHTLHVVPMAAGVAAVTHQQQQEGTAAGVQSTSILIHAEYNGHVPPGGGGDGEGAATHHRRDMNSSGSSRRLVGSSSQLGLISASAAWIASAGNADLLPSWSPSDRATSTTTRAQQPQPRLHDGGVVRHPPASAASTHDDHNSYHRNGRQTVSRAGNRRQVATVPPPPSSGSRNGGRSPWQQAGGGSDNPAGGGGYVTTTDGRSPTEEARHREFERFATRAHAALAEFISVGRWAEWVVSEASLASMRHRQAAAIQAVVVPKPGPPDGQPSGGGQHSLMAVSDDSIRMMPSRGGALSYGKGGVVQTQHGVEHAVSEADPFMTAVSMFLLDEVLSRSEVFAPVWPLLRKELVSSLLPGLPADVHAVSVNPPHVTAAGHGHRRTATNIAAGAAGSPHHHRTTMASNTSSRNGDDDDEGLLVPVTIVDADLRDVLSAGSQHSHDDTAVVRKEVAAALGSPRERFEASAAAEGPRVSPLDPPDDNRDSIVASTAGQVMASPPRTPPCAPLVAPPPAQVPFEAPSSSSAAAGHEPTTVAGPLAGATSAPVTTSASFLPPFPAAPPPSSSSRGHRRQVVVPSVVTAAASVSPPAVGRRQSLPCPSSSVIPSWTPTGRSTTTDEGRGGAAVDPPPRLSSSTAALAVAAPAPWPPLTLVKLMSRHDMFSDRHRRLVDQIHQLSDMIRQQRASGERLLILHGMLEKHHSRRLIDLTFQCWRHYAARIAHQVATQTCYFGHQCRRRKLLTSFSVWRRITLSSRGRKLQRALDEERVRLIARISEHNRTIAQISQRYDADVKTLEFELFQESEAKKNLAAAHRLEVDDWRADQKVKDGEITYWKTQARKWQRCAKLSVPVDDPDPPPAFLLNDLCALLAVEEELTAFMALLNQTQIAAFSGQSTALRAMLPPGVPIPGCIASLIDAPSSAQNSKEGDALVAAIQREYQSLIMRARKQLETFLCSWVNHELAAHAAALQAHSGGSQRLARPVRPPVAQGPYGASSATNPFAAGNVPQISNCGADLRDGLVYLHLHRALCPPHLLRRGDMDVFVTLTHLIHLYSANGLVVPLIATCPFIKRFFTAETFGKAFHPTGGLWILATLFVGRCMKVATSGRFASAKEFSGEFAAENAAVGVGKAPRPSTIGSGPSSTAFAEDAASSRRAGGGVLPGHLGNNTSSVGPLSGAPSAATLSAVTGGGRGGSASAAASAAQLMAQTVPATTTFAKPPLGWQCMLGVTPGWVKSAAVALQTSSLSASLGEDHVTGGGGGRANSRNNRGGGNLSSSGMVGLSSEAGGDRRVSGAFGKAIGSPTAEEKRQQRLPNSTPSVGFAPSSPRSGGGRAGATPAAGAPLTMLSIRAFDAASLNQSATMTGGGKASSGAHATGRDARRASNRPSSRGSSSRGSVSSAGSADSGDSLVDSEDEWLMGEEEEAFKSMVPPAVASCGAAELLRMWNAHKHNAQQWTSLARLVTSLVVRVRVLDQDSTYGRKEDQKAGGGLLASTSMA